jgi:hypothetical protein
MAVTGNTPPSPPPRGYPPIAKFPTGSTGGKGKPVAPKANAAWAHLSGAIATQLPTGLRRARIFRQAALRSLR